MLSLGIGIGFNVLGNQVGHAGPAGPVGRFIIGTNLSGLENEFPSAPTAAQFAYFVQKSIPFIRLPIGWCKFNAFQGQNVGIQITQFAALNPAYTAILDPVMDAAATAGAKILLDLHTFGGGPGGTVGAEVPIEAFADVWVKIVQRYGNHPALYGIDLMNEWVNGFSFDVAFNAQQLAINGVRAAGYGGWIYVEGVNYSGAWNWVNGETQPYNNNLLYTLHDPLAQLVIEPHCYLDNDSSGTNFSWALEIAKAGASPPGTPTSHNIGVQRLTVPVEWALLHRMRMGIGEMGASADAYEAGGALNYADWMIALENAIQYCQTNNVEFWYWGTGPGFATGFLPNGSGVGYGYNAEPFSPVDLRTKDYTATGVQSPQMTVLAKYSGYAGAQPLAYALARPVVITPTGNPAAPSVIVASEGAVGVQTGDFTVYYGGTRATPVTITPAAKYPDGTDAGGTFSPATATLAVGDNPKATFKYTPANAATLAISTTNNAGLTNPPALGLFTGTNLLAGFPLSTASVYWLKRFYGSYIGPAIRLQRSSDGAQQDFYFNNRGDLPRQAIQDWAQSAKPFIATIYNQVNSNHLVFSSFKPRLYLDDGTGYPAVVWPTGNNVLGFQSSTNGKGQQTLLAAVKSTGGIFITQDVFLGTFRYYYNQYTVGQNSGSLPSYSINTGASSNTWNFTVDTWSNLYGTNNLKNRLNGTLNNQSNAGQFTWASNDGANTHLGGFRFGDAHFTGSWRGFVILYQEATGDQADAFWADYNTYYTTPLPDALTPFIPTVAPAETALPAPVSTFTPPTKFKGVNISGGDNPYPSPNQFNYAYPNNDEIDYWASKGMTCIRMTLRGRRLQPESYGALDPVGRADEPAQIYRTYPAGSQTNILSIRDVLERARLRNMWVMFDIHDFGGITDTYEGINLNVGTDAQGRAQLKDLCVRILQKFKNYNNWLFDLQNEPVGMTATQWRDTVLDILPALAAVSTSVPIVVEGGGNWSGAHDWVSSGNGTAFAPSNFTVPAGMTIYFSPHQYLDSNNSGQSSTVVAGKGATALINFTNWARSHGYKAILGEAGWSYNDSQASGGVPSTEGAALFGYMTANSDVWDGWQYWNGGNRLFYAVWSNPGSYIFSTTPAGYPSGPFTDAPQTAIMVANL